MPVKLRRESIDELRKLVPFKIDRDYTSNHAGVTFLYGPAVEGYYSATTKEKFGYFEADELVIVWQEGARGVWDHSKSKLTSYTPAAWVICSADHRVHIATDEEIGQLVQRVTVDGKPLRVDAEGKERAAKLAESKDE